MNEQKSWEKSGYVNPYGFVSIAEKEPERKTIEEWSEKAGECYTGKITYTLETLSPLFIPDTSNENGRDKEVHQEYQFFSYGDGIPVIPGSEVRGMVRNLYETLTNSCISFINEKEVLSKRTPEYFIPGILKRETTGYKLIQVDETKDYLYRENGREDFSVQSFNSEYLPTDGSEIYFDWDREIAPKRPKFAKPFAKNIYLEKQDRKKRGYLLKGVSGPELARSRGSDCRNCPSLTREKCREKEEKRCYFLEKHCAHIFTEEYIWDKKTKTNVLPKSISISNFVFEDICKRMDIILQVYKRNADEEQQKSYQEYADTWKKFLNKQQNGIPLYFSQISDEIIYVSPAKITREVYRNTLKDMLENQSKHTSCESGSLCPACALFGTVQKQLKVASKLRFSDMQIVTKENYFESPLVLPELSSPKLSTTEFYLQKPEDTNGSVLNWTYDYYILLPENGVPIEKLYIPTLAGRKFYWHSPNTVKLLRSITIEKTKRNKTVNPVKPKTIFTGEVYFEGITKKQLDELIGILNLSQEQKNGTPIYGAKLGAGKPVGLGSVALSVTDIHIRQIRMNKETCKISYEEKTYDELFSTSKTSSYHSIRLQECFIYHQEVLKFLELNALKGKIAYYPFVINSKEENEGFQWFVENRKAVGIDRKSGRLLLDKSDSGPKSRKQTIYHKYMGTAKPELLFNKIKQSK